MNPPFVLYGLIGCPHCAEAEDYLKRSGVPFMSHVADDDPIISEGIKKLTGKETVEYPALLCKATKNIIIGYRPENYEKSIRAFYSLVGTSTPSVFGGQQQPVLENKKQVEITNVS